LIANTSTSWHSSGARKGSGHTSCRRIASNSKPWD
jgi:hypothetical protein